MFLAYDHDDASAVSDLRDALVRAGLQVWWDQSIVQGDVVDALEKAIRGAACVVPLWTSKSVTSTWVRDEIRVAVEAGRPICAVRLEPVSPPVGYGQMRSYDLYDWRGTGAPRLKDLVKALTAIVGRSASRFEPTLTLESKKTLRFPCFVRSVSSHETFLPPDVAVHTLHLLNTDAVLVSAYDVAHDKTRRLARRSNRLARAGSVVFLDSGNYEAFRKADKNWTASGFRKVLPQVRADLVFAFDNVNAPSNERILVRDTISAYTRLTEATRATAIPVLHLPRSRSGVTRIESAPALASQIVQDTHSRFIAIPERELGGGVFARAKAVWALRQELNLIRGPKCFIHLLGTGNPLSMAIFAAVGADSFDGLEWCRTSADDETMLLFHSQQFDFFRYQAERSLEPIVRAAAVDESLNYSVRTALHNLGVMANWIRVIQKAASEQTLDRLLTGMLPKGAFEQLASHVPDAFSRAAPR